MTPGKQKQCPTPGPLHLRLEGKCPAGVRNGKHDEYLHGTGDGWFVECRACGAKKEWKKP